MKKVNLSTAAQILDTPPATILTWHKKKLIKGERYNSGNWLFNLEELIAMKQSHQGEKAVAKFTTLKSPDRTNFKVMELFAGCGGLALGFENAGLETQLLVEIDKDCVNTLNLNRPNWQTINDDVTKINFAEFTNQIDILAGGFPCQSFSYAGLGKGLEDTRGTLFFQFARCLQTIRPKIALAENVRGLLSHKKGETLAIMLNTFRDLGYYPVYRLLSSQFLDVPQKRERLIILATRNDLQIKPIFPQEKNYTISLRQALEDCPESDGMAYNQRKKTVMNLVPPGGNWRDLPLDVQKDYMKNSWDNGGGRTGYAKRLSWDEPALTITCSPAQTQTERCHPQETRPLTVREYARVQSFPDDWQFTGSLSSQYKQIGNAVPVNMGYHLGRCLIAMLRGEKEPEIPNSRDIQQLSIPGLRLD